jgi:hypothetical protein
MMGAALGYWWDLLRRPPETFGSGALCSTVVGGVLTIPTLVLAHPQFATSPNPNLSMALFIGIVSLLASAFKSLLDDLHYSYFAGVHSDEELTPLPKQSRGTLGDDVF